MRILIVGNTYYPGSNGQAIFSIHLAEGLARAGHDVMFVTPGEHLTARAARINGVDVRKRASLPLTLVHPEAYVTFPIDPSLRRLIAGFRPDVVHIQDHYPLSRVATVVSKRLGLPLVGTNHFLPENVLPYVPDWLPLKRSHKIRILWWTMLSLYNQFDLVTTPTETAARILRAQDLRVRVVPVSCGVDTDRFCPDPFVDRAAVRQKYCLDPDRSLFLYVGRLDREKRLDLLLKAFAQLNRDDARLVIGGKGAEAGALAALARHLQIHQKVRFTGYIPHADLPKVLNSVDFFCMPSPEELQSIATLEAMASGLPVLAADARALPELVEQGGNGCLFRPGDAADAARGMAALLDAGAGRERMSRSSLARAQAHSLENTIRRYTELYQSLLPVEEHNLRESVMIV